MLRMSNGFIGCKSSSRAFILQRTAGVWDFISRLLAQAGCGSMAKYGTLLRYARPQRRFFILIFALTVTASALVALQPWPMKLVADYVLGPKTFPEGAHRVL